MSVLKLLQLWTRLETNTTKTTISCSTNFENLKRKSNLFKINSQMRRRKPTKSDELTPFFKTTTTSLINNSTNFRNSRTSESNTLRSYSIMLNKRSKLTAKLLRLGESSLKMNKIGISWLSTISINSKTTIKSSWEQRSSWRWTLKTFETKSSRLRSTNRIFKLVFNLKSKTLSSLNLNSKLWPSTQTTSRANTKIMFDDSMMIWNAKTNSSNELENAVKWSWKTSENSYDNS